MSDNDGIDDALRNATQLTAGMLARLGEAHSRATQQHAIDQEHAVTAASARTEQQIWQAAGRERAAMARLRLVHDPNWWAAATIGQVGDTWQIADAHRGRQDADAAREIMAREITTHWRVTPETDADSALFVASLNRPDMTGTKSTSKIAAPSKTAIVGELSRAMRMETGMRTKPTTRPSCDPRR